MLRAGSTDQHARARTVLGDARRALYQILADDDATDDATDVRHDHARLRPRRLSPRPELGICDAVREFDAQFGGVQLKRASARSIGSSTTPNSATTAASHSGRTTADTAIGWSRPEPCTAMRTNSTA